MGDLLKRTIRLAYINPGLRLYLLPIIKEATFYREEKSPEDWNQNFEIWDDRGVPRQDNVYNQPEGVITWLDGEPRETKNKGREVSVRPITNMPGSSRVIPDHNTDLVNKKLVSRQGDRCAAYISQIERDTSSSIKERSLGYQPILLKEDKKRYIREFKVGKYEVRVKSGSDINSNIWLSCSCRFWKYGGPEYWASRGGYLLGEPRGTATRPEQRDPSGKNRCCKHVYAVFSVIKKDTESSFI